MRDYIEERAEEIGQYIVESGATVRQTAKEFGVSKSTVHKDVTERLQQINPSLAGEARKVLDVNKEERHIPRWTCHKRKIPTPARLRIIQRIFSEQQEDGHCPLAS